MKKSKINQPTQKETRELTAEERYEQHWKEIDEKFKDEPLYDPVKARLYDAAQRARYHGDEESSRGYMSALGDIGR